MAKIITLREITSFVETAQGQPCEVIRAITIKMLKQLEEQIKEKGKKAKEIEESGNEKKNFYHMGIAITCEKILGEILGGGQ